MRVVCVGQLSDAASPFLGAPPPQHSTLAFSLCISHTAFYSLVFFLSLTHTPHSTRSLSLSSSYSLPPTRARSLSRTQHPTLALSLAHTLGFWSQSHSPTHSLSRTHTHCHIRAFASAQTPSRSGSRPIPQRFTSDPAPVEAQIPPRLELSIARTHVHSPTRRTHPQPRTHATHARSHAHTHPRALTHAHDRAHPTRALTHAHTNARARAQNIPRARAHSTWSGSKTLSWTHARFEDAP